MKTSLKPLLCIVLIFIFQSILIQAQDKFAFLVGVSDYPVSSGWNTLNANNDIEWMKTALIDQGFAEKNIFTLKDQEATKEGVFTGFEHFLIQKVQPGDVVVFHFSGHGQQLCDQDNDEIDGLDEALVPYDSPLHFKAGSYEGEKLIRDDELEQKFDRLRKKLGNRGHLLVILDACHSGTATRGLSKSRGTNVLMAPENFVSKFQKNSLRGNIDRGEFLHSNSDFFKKNGQEDTNASMVVFSATRANELNHEVYVSEGMQIGPLSYALAKALSNTPRDGSYRALFDKVRVTMNALVPEQHPNIEGRLDMEIMGGDILGCSQYFTLKKGGRLSKSMVKLQGGKLHGLFPGTVVGFYPTDTRNPDRSLPITTGEVLRSGLADCTVKLGHPLSEKQALNSWVFVTEQTFGETQIRIKVNLPEGEIWNAFRRKSREFPIIQLVEDHPTLIVEKDRDQIRVVTTDELVLFSMKSKFSPDLVADKVLMNLLEYVRSQFLQELEIDEKSFDFQLELIPISSTSDKNLENNKTKTFSKGLTFKLGDRFKFRVTNNGQMPAYFTILEIDAGKNIFVHFPDEKQSVEDLYLDPSQNKEWLSQNTYSMSKPLGTGVLKLITSSDPIDLREVESTRGGIIEESDHTFVKFFADTFYYEKRGKRGGRLSLGTKVDVQSIIYESVK